MNLDQAKKVFRDEARELLAKVESIVLNYEQSSEKLANLHALFRAVHTLKGSGGMFGLEATVRFAHRIEEALEFARENRLQFKVEALDCLLSCHDHLQTLVSMETGHLQVDDGAALEKTGQALAQQFHGHIGYRAGATELAGPSAQEISELESQPAMHTAGWLIFIQPQEDLFEQGLDLAATFRYLSKHFRILNLETELTHLNNSLSDFNATKHYLTYWVAMDAQASREGMAEALEYYQEVCTIGFLPPNPSLLDFTTFVDATKLSEDKVVAMLGQLDLFTSGLRINAEQNSGETSAPATGPQTSENNPAQTSANQANTPPASSASANKAQAGPSQPGLNQAGREQTNSPQAGSGNGQSQVGGDDLTIRVPSSKMDEVFNLIGELVIANSRLRQFSIDDENDRLTEMTGGVSRLIHELREKAMSMRMVPVAHTFQRLKRAVREVAAATGKDVNYQIIGGDTELDKTIIEKVSDIMLHIVRNAVDHGIELPDARLAAGKPAQGTLTVTSYHETGSIVIEIRDDGGGLNTEAIFQKAIQRGLVAADAQLTDEEIHTLIFEPGFSTASVTTDISGRGVGMDVVRRHVEALRGSVRVLSEAGMGTCIRLRLPLTLAIMDGFLIQSAGVNFILPLDLVHECIDNKTFKGSQSVSGSFLNLRGEVVPYVHLSQHFELTSKDSREAGPARRNLESVVIAKVEDKKFGLITDSILGELQTVLKPLGQIFESYREIGGASILGSGEIAFILDVPSLIASIHNKETADSASLGESLAKANSREQSP